MKKEENVLKYETAVEDIKNDPAYTFPWLVKQDKQIANAEVIYFVKDTPGKGYDAVKSMGLRQQMAMRKKAETVTAEVFDFSAGDRVKHKIFGDGTILSAAPMGNDMLLEVAFDSRGTKKIMAKFSKLVKL